MSTALTKAGRPRKRVTPGASLADRVLLHTDRSGECWIWTAAIDKSTGYGRVSIGGKVGYGHRIAYEAFVGPIPAGMEIDHLCRNRACCRPEHLEAVTPQVNVLRGESPGAKARRRDLCFHGQHLYADHGFVDRDGRRRCRACQIQYCRLWKLVPYEEAMSRKRAGLPVVDLAAFYEQQRRQDEAA